MPTAIGICGLVFLACAQLLSAQTVNLCGASDSYNSTTVPYIFNNNAWGNDSSGYQCLDVEDQGTSFSVTYLWTGTSTMVKGYPYMKADPARFPVQLWNMSSLVFSGEWSTTVASAKDNSSLSQAEAYDEIDLHSNVALDMFLSPDALNSTGFRPPIEIMIWLWWCPTVIPLGYRESTPDTEKITIDGTAFRLYSGYNIKNQHVFSWLADRNLTTANADYGPLLQYVWQNKSLPGSTYLGQLEFGTEILHAGGETVFKAKDYNLKIVRHGDPNETATTSTTPATNSTPASTSTLSTPVASNSPEPSSMAARLTSRDTLPFLILGFIVLLAWLHV